MNADVLPRAGSRGPLSALLMGGIVLGTLDIAFAYAFWISKGATVAGIFRSIAAGVLGDASRQGGAAAAWLGAGLHYFIATMMVAAYYLAARTYPALVQRPVAFGLPYGLVLYAAMNFVVLPLSAAGMAKFDNAAWIASSIFMHAVFGVICAVFARKALAAR
ncbi:hypothetical protein M2650_07230 [Luteimonas sp. SX5]|uniref:DUF1440 domain-containing protein n=1 Tax=Luteimonas galliterrae TaxID=2940486 RepID=A0ABT0MII4_9GAMM|nr:hypothetical protein [Luteimonas galliterrae]MCL1634423.1 hypothetical protein [Luteimonas galliterrae]